jgi:hypothetical protein
MIRLTYNGKHLSGQLTCQFCGESYELTGSAVRTYIDEKGIIRTIPDARRKVYAHFHFDKNAFMPECPAIGKSQIESTTWEAVDEETGKVVARGRLVMPVHENSIGPISVVQDEPPSD